MKPSGNTVLITGGGSGIGRALAEALHRADNRVIVTGRRATALAETTRANPGMEAMPLDVDDPTAIRAFAAEVTRRFPALNVVVHNAGIMRPEEVRAGADHVATAEATITTNLLGPIRLNAALLPHLLAQPTATVVTVTSGLAFVPLAAFPTYCATKAALHSFTESLRYQLQDTAVEVVELPPPYVQTELTGEHQKTDPRAMPLAAFTQEVMGLLTAKPAPKEVLVEHVKPLRSAAQGDYDGFFKSFNDAMAGGEH